jgi:hypothetical protein
MSIQFKVLLTMFVLFMLGMLMAQAAKQPSQTHGPGRGWKALAGFCVIGVFPWAIWCIWSAL